VYVYDDTMAIMTMVTMYFRLSMQVHSMVTGLHMLWRRDYCTPLATLQITVLI